MTILLSLDNSRHSRNPDLVKISVIIPAYNEAHTIAAVIERVKSVALNGIPKEIIVVDDASTDGTSDVLKDIRDIYAIRHDTNAGKGAALGTGIQAATGDVVIFQDADLEYAPEDYPVVIQPLIENRCDPWPASILGHAQIPLPQSLHRQSSHHLGHELLV